MKEVSLFEREEYEKMMKTLGINQKDGEICGEIKYPDKDYLISWDLGYVGQSGRNSAETI